MFRKMLSYKAGWKEIALIKISAFSIALLFAKLWQPLLTLKWFGMELLVYLQQSSQY